MEETPAVGVHNEDRLSSLPEDLIIAHIMSQLSTKSAVATSVLSPRWRNLWTQALSRLSFIYNSDSLKDDLETELLQRRRFIMGIDHVLGKLTCRDISTFELSFDRCISWTKDELECCYSFLDSWFGLVCARHPNKIEVCVDYDFNDMPADWPTFLLDCSSLVSLELRRAPLMYALPDDGRVNLPNLKDLGICICEVNLPYVTCLFSSCPMLEDLRLDTRLKEIDYTWYEEDFEYANSFVLDISCPNLKRLIIRPSQDDQRPLRFSIDTPKLEEIKVDYTESLSFSFVEKPAGLIKAKIAFHSDLDKDHCIKTLDFFHGISSVRYLKIQSWNSVIRDITCYSRSLYDEDDDFPLFPNLVQLHYRGTCPLWLFERRAPNLEVLNFCMSDIVREDHQLPSSLVCRLKRIEIEGYLDDIDDPNHCVMGMLGDAKALEHLVVHCYPGESLHTLLSYPRSSSICEVTVYNFPFKKKERKSR